MRIVYFDCTAGAAGDMILGALLDAGAPLDRVMECLDALELDDWSLDVEVTTRGELRATKATVLATNGGAARPYADIVRLISNAGLPGNVTERSLRVFEALATAEARVHGRTMDDVHLHEVGDVDSIIDIVGSCAALEHFMPARIVTSAIATGTGTVATHHGELPIPAPAVLEILHGAALFGRATDHELVTPTGAAILAAITDEFGDLPPLTIQTTGTGAGSRDHAWPNVVRVVVGEPVHAAGSGDDVLVIEANIDDMSPEFVPDVIEMLLAAGAQDAWVAPIVMKKGRPGFTLSVLADASSRDRVTDVVFRETTTLGLRVTAARKDALPREWIEVDVASHPVRVKVGRRAGEVVTMSPEHDDAVKAARGSGLPLKEVYARALIAARDHESVR
jgi:uncharacterized protein (TIGR00299 family) protein